MIASIALSPNLFFRSALIRVTAIVRSPQKLPPAVREDPNLTLIQAADYLRVQVGQNHPQITWTAVRPDGLVDEEKVSEYDLYPSPIRSPIFDPGKTSRSNVAHFMADLINDQETWRQWQGQMPVIYNRVQ